MPKKAVAPHSERESVVVSIRVNKDSLEAFKISCAQSKVSPSFLLQRMIEVPLIHQRLLSWVTTK